MYRRPYLQCVLLHYLSHHQILPFSCFSRAAPPAPKEGVVTVRRVQSAGPVSHAASLRQSIVELSPRQQRHVSVKRVGSLSKGTTLSAEECIARVSRGAERIKDSNRKLVASCK